MAEGAIRAGCRMFAGYPITPQTEILEYMSSHMREAAESSFRLRVSLQVSHGYRGRRRAGQESHDQLVGPGFSLKQEGISYLSSMELPAVIVDVMRYGIGLGNVVLDRPTISRPPKAAATADTRYRLCPGVCTGKCRLRVQGV